LGSTINNNVLELLSTVTSQFTSNPDFNFDDSINYLTELLPTQTDTELSGIISAIIDGSSAGNITSINDIIDTIKSASVTDLSSILSSNNIIDNLLNQVGSFDSILSGLDIGNPLADLGFPVEELLSDLNSFASIADNFSDTVDSFSDNNFVTNLTSGILSSATSLLTSESDTLSGIVDGLIGDKLDILSSGTDIINSLSGFLGISAEQIDPVDLFFSVSSNVANLLTGGFSVASLSGEGGSSGIVTISSQDTTTIKELTSVDFQIEGGTPPTKGVYGGPNFAGASPVLTFPSVDMSQYEGGSTLPLNTTIPPSVKISGNASANIEILLSACEKYGLTTNEQKATLLAIVGGECAWNPTEESSQYSNPKRLCQIFPSTFKGDIKLAEQFSNWDGGKKGTKSEFFDFIYDPANNGRRLGNIIPGDGGKYYGRGFIQLTGRANYERYARLSGYDIINEPDLLINDPVISAEIAVIYFLDRVKHATPTAHPQYFYAAKKAVGNNSPDIAARKLAYYEHFYGIKTPESYGYTNKEAGNSLSNYSYFGGLNGVTSGLPLDVGFRDPHNKYPLKRYLNEPDTSRLARGVIKETIVQLKESQRTIGVPIAIDGRHWDQPTVPYGAKYPYNYVEESESGHYREVDDTPGYERLHTYHRSGTFEEIDVNGTKVTKIVGDNYTILDRNGFISISGDANVTVTGNINIMCQSDANIEVTGSAEMKIGGSLDIGVARDMNIAVEGDFSLWANGKMNLQSKQNANIRTDNNMFLSSNIDTHLLSENDMFFEIKNNFNKVIHNTSKTDCKSHHFLTVGGDLKNETFSNYSLYTGGKISNQSVGISEFKCSGNFNVDAEEIYLNSQKAQIIPTLQKEGGELGSIYTGNSYFDFGQGKSYEELLSSTIAYSGLYSKTTQNALPTIKSLVNGMVPPQLGVPLYPSYTPLVSPPLLGSDKYLYELPDEGSTQAAQLHIKDMTAQHGKSNTFQSLTAEPTKSGSGNPTLPSMFSGTAFEYTADYKLSEHFTLGMMFDGGFNVRHKLISQNGLTVDQIVENLSSLCVNILEKYLTVLPNGIQGYRKDWTITSGYRMGINTSDHSRGCACDISLLGGSDMREQHFELIKQLEPVVAYDQLILEYKGFSTSWIHTGFRGDGNLHGARSSNRFQSFTMVNHKMYNNSKFILVA